MPRRTHLVIENDVFTRVLEIILDPEEHLKIKSRDLSS